MKNLFRFVCVIGALVLIGAGCGGSSAPDGGVFHSVDAGTTWDGRSDIFATRGRTLSFSTLDVNVMALDPTNASALWVGTMTNGILFTDNVGGGWLLAQTYSPPEVQLDQSRINGIAVDPTDGCIVYATTKAPNGNSYIVRTLNCGRTWGLLYTDAQATNQLQAIAINPANHLEVFVGDSVGTIIRSENGGSSWVKIKTFDNAGVRAIAINPHHPNEVWVGTRVGGLWKSSDNGASWVPMDLKTYAGADDVYSIAFDLSKDDSLLVGSKYGIVHSDDGGTTWDALQLLTAPKETQILTIAVNPKNSNHIYYGTPKAFYRSEDGGKSWTTKRVPTARNIKNLLLTTTTVGGQDVETLWLGAWVAPS